MKTPTLTREQTERRAFLDDIIEHPDDDTPRLVYADWLDDRGEEQRGQFIRLQCEIARLAGGGEVVMISTNDPAMVRASRILGLQSQVERLWYAPAQGFPNSPAGWIATIGEILRDIDTPILRVHRGFAVEILCPLDRLLADGKAVIKDNPVERVTLIDRFPYHRGNGMWMWFAAHVESPRSCLPSQLFGRVNRRTHASREEAIEWASRGLIAMIRKRE